MSLTENQNEVSENENNQEVECFGDQSKEKYQNCCVLGRKAMDCKAEFHQIGGKNSGNHSNFQENTSNGTYCTYYRQPGHS
jgi:hypothetical protein